MIHADKNVLKAKLEKGYFDLQFQLIDLYVGNLQAFGSMAAFTAGCAYTSIGEIEIPTTGTFIYAFHYLFDIFIHATLALSVFATSQSALVLIFGPTKGFAGANIDTVKIVQSSLLEQRNFIMLLFLCMLGTTYLSLIMNFICKVPWETSTSTSIIFFVGFTMTLGVAAHCYAIFNPVGEEFAGSNARTKTFFTDQFPGVKYSRTASEGLDDDHDKILENDMKKVKDKIMKFKANGIIYWRGDLDDNTPLRLRFAALANGKVDIFKSEEDYDNGGNPLNNTPFNLAEYRIETDYNHFPRSNTTAGTFLNKAIAGQAEFSIFDIATSEHDLVQASKNFRFFLIPCILNEIKPLKMIEFMCTNAESYKKWTAAFHRSCKHCRELYLMLQQTAEEFDDRGKVDVELVLARSGYD